jgi:hypothetical protein
MPGWLAGVAVSAVTRPDAVGWAVVALVSVLAFTAWVITCDLRTSRLQSLILALAARRGRSGDGIDVPVVRGRAAEAGEPSPGSRKGESWTDRFRRRKG